MTKYITIFIVTFLMLGCGTKAPSAHIENETKQVIIKKPQRMTLPEGFQEITKLRPIGSNVPQACQEWSDGCNTCSRANGHQASCTVYTCETKAAFSCLKWQ